MPILGAIGGFATQILGGVVDYNMAKLQYAGNPASGIRLADIQGKTPGADSPYIPNFLEFGLTGNQLDAGCNTQSRTQHLSVTIDKATGAVISVCKSKRRKRRRRLATCSDISDLIQLKATLGGGQALSSWIAKNGRC